MLGLRSKLMFGFGGLLLIVLIVSILAQTVMEHYSEAIRKSYREDYESVAVCQSMKESVEQIDLATQGALWGRPPDPAKIRNLRGDFEHRLAMQREDATLPGEGTATEQLAEAWRDYSSAYPPVLSGSTPLPDRQALYLKQMLPQSQRLRSAAQRLIDMNLSSILSVPAKAQASALQAHWAMRTLTISALVLSLVFAALIGRIILRPVRLLTISVHEIENGNLNLAVPVQSHDELGSLATAFNNMAEKLRAYRQSADDRLVRTERTTQMAIDSLPDAVFVINTDGRIELANGVARRLLGLSPGALVAESSLRWLVELWERVTRARHAPELNDYESIVELEVESEPRQFLPRSVPILNNSGQPIGTTVVLADVTGLRRLDGMKNSLLSLVSHELKTPLTSARMVLHLVTEHKVGPLTAKQDELLQAARDDTDRLHVIVENLLDMSRIESGRALMELRPILPDALVSSVIDSLASSFQSQNVSLCSVLEPDPPAVLADPTRIGHVFANLLMNSLRHTPTGGSVRISARSTGDVVEFVVADTGSGIPRQFLHRVFDKFFRVPGQSSASGSGLGLSIAKDIVEAHGGQIRIDSKEGIGTNVVFSLRRCGEAPALH